MMIKNTQLSRRTDLAIMNLKAGETLNRRTEEALARYVTIDTGCIVASSAFPWSQSDSDANELLEHIEDCVGEVCVIRGITEASWDSRHQVTIGDEEDGTVTVWSSDWKEAVCKAFLLHENGFRGNYAPIPKGEVQ